MWGFFSHIRSYLGKVVLNGVGLFRIKNSSNLILVESSTVLSDSVLVVKLSKVGRKDWGKSGKFSTTGFSSNVGNLSGLFSPNSPSSCLMRMGLRVIISIDGGVVVVGT